MKRAARGSSTRKSRTGTVSKGSVRKGPVRPSFKAAAQLVKQDVEAKKEYRAKLGPKIKQFIMESKNGNKEAIDKLAEAQSLMKNLGNPDFKLNNPSFKDRFQKLVPDIEQNKGKTPPKESLKLNQTQRKKKKIEESRLFRIRKQLLGKTTENLKVENLKVENLKNPQKFQNLITNNMLKGVDELKRPLVKEFLGRALKDGYYRYKPGEDGKVKLDANKITSTNLEKAAERISKMENISTAKKGTTLKNISAARQVRVETQKQLDADIKEIKKTSDPNVTKVLEDLKESFVSKDSKLVTEEGFKKKTAESKAAEAAQQKKIFDVGRNRELAARIVKALKKAKKEEQIDTQRRMIELLKKITEANKKNKEVVFDEKGPAYKEFLKVIEVEPIMISLSQKYAAETRQQAAENAQKRIADQIGETVRGRMAALRAKIAQQGGYTKKKHRKINKKNKKNSKILKTRKVKKTRKNRNNRR